MNESEVARRERERRLAEQAGRLAAANDRPATSADPAYQAAYRQEQLRRQA